MKTISLNKVIGMLFIALCFVGCINKKSNIKPEQSQLAVFNQNDLKLKETCSVKKVRGQVLYLPVYSNIPYHEHNRLFDLSAFVAIHNTDFFKTLTINKVLFFNNDGKLVANYIKKDTVLNPLGAINFFVPEKDKSGTGANFIIEWYSDTLINEPLIESVMIGLTSGQGISFLSKGEILRELK